jgi:DNA primase
MAIPEHKLEEVLRRVDMLGLVGRYVELRRSGKDHKGRCPFHQEKTPSFYVYPEKKRFKCYGCEAGGDAFTFLQRYLGKTFLDTVRDLAREVGVDLEGAEDPVARERAQLREAVEFAAAHYSQRLWEAKGAAARAYLLEERGVSEETVRRFGLGFAPPGWSDLADRILQAGTTEFAVKAALIQPRSKGEGYIDFFRHRLMIPIRSPEGRPIAFGGRQMDKEDGGPKYLNSRESALYRKSEVLYGMDQARDEVRRRKSAVLVEGYFDCIGLHQAGIRHALALCSTTLTPGHLALLQRGGALSVTLLLDGDEAGLRAVERLAGSLLAAGMATKVALLPTGDDPDVFARREGAAAVEALLGAARPLTEYLFTACLPGGPQAGFEEKMQALERLKPVVSQLPVGLARSAFLGGMAKHFGLPASQLEGTLQGKAPPPVRPAPKPAAPPSRPPERYEAYYGACLLRVPALLHRDSLRAGDDLTHMGLRVLVGRLTAGEAPEDCLQDADPSLQRALEAAAGALPEDPVLLEQGFLKLCHRLKLQAVEKQLQAIQQRAGAAQGDLDEETREALQRASELAALRQRLKGEAAAIAAGIKSAPQPV